jgi:1-acyl-sn-glycerol-3-phosphate acyltransferase
VPYRFDAMGRVRFWARSVVLGTLLALCLPLHGLWRLLRLSSPWPRLYLRAATRAIGIHVEIVGKPLRRDVFFVGNHLSWTDICVLGGLTGCAFVAQDKIADWPVIGWLAKLNHTIFVSRTARMTVGTQVDALRLALADRQAVTIFPEGTTTDGGYLLPFKASLFQVLMPPPRALRIQPVFLAFDRAGRNLAWIGSEGAPDNARRTLANPGTCRCRVHFLEPFDPGDHPDRKTVSAECRKRLEAALELSLAAGQPG